MLRSYQKIKSHASTLLFFFILIYFCGLIGYDLDNIPGEWFGDISIVNNYVQTILSGDFPLYFSTSAGPLYFYLIAPFVFLFGPSFFTYKILSGICGLLGLIVIYFWVKTIASKSLALLTMFLTASSFWYIVWARLGNFNIITPVLTAAMLYYVFDFKKNRRYASLFFSIFISSLGLYTYPGVFLLPVIQFILVLVFIIREKTIRKEKIFVLLFMGISYLFTAGFFGYIILHNFDNFSTGYMGKKIFMQQPLSIEAIVTRTTHNALRTIGMLHKEGDIVFRWNVSKSPQLDGVSGIFFLIGCVVVLYHFKRYGWIFIPLLLLPLPSLLPTHPLIEIPSSPRTMAIIPIVFFITALGIERVYTLIKGQLHTKLSWIVCLLSLIVIAFLNIHTYFIDYPKGLPNGNIPYGKVVASYITRLPPTYHIYFTSYEWGEWAQPSKDSIYYSLQHTEGKSYLLNEAVVENCEAIQNTDPMVIIFNPHDEFTFHHFKQCFPSGVKTVYKVDTQPVFTALVIP